MTTEEKQLLIKDLCARLPYHDLWVQYYNKDWLAIGYGHERIELLSSIFSSVTGPCPLIDEIKPYLRLMSSMTEEEAAEFEILSDKLLLEADNTKIWNSVIDWLNEHHFDHRGLIEMGLALEAPVDMYKTE